MLRCPSENGGKGKVMCGTKADSPCNHQSYIDKGIRNESSVVEIETILLDGSVYVIPSLRENDDHEIGSFSVLLMDCSTRSQKFLLPLRERGRKHQLHIQSINDESIKLRKYCLGDSHT